MNKAPAGLPGLLKIPVEGLFGDDKLKLGDTPLVSPPMLNTKLGTFPSPFLDREILLLSKK